MASWFEIVCSYGMLGWVKLLGLAHVIVSVVTYAVAVALGGRFKEKMVRLDRERSVTLLVTAHPDDECMFFSPFLLQMRQDRASEVHVLCLTNGNYYGQGKQREKEILSSCHLLGIPEDNVTVINDSNLPDDPRAEWEVSSLEQHLHTAVDKIHPSQIVTFDDYGVSGHSNHITIAKAIRKIQADGNTFKGVDAVYYLESVSLWRKYLGVFDLPFTLLFSSNVYLLSPQHILYAQKAMLAHRSQLEWFRLLYILLSRYMLVNSYSVWHLAA